MLLVFKVLKHCEEFFSSANSFFFLSPILMLTLCLPIDGMASNINQSYMEMLDHANLSFLAPF